MYYFNIIFKKENLFEDNLVFSKTKEAYIYIINYLKDFINLNIKINNFNNKSITRLKK